MDLIVFGLNFKTSSIAEREALSLPESDIENFLRKFHETEGVHGVVYVATCNRIEIYAAISSLARSEFALAKVGGSANNSPQHPPWLPLNFSPAYTYFNEAAFAHLVKVGCGLDSLVLGETEVFGQIKEAYSKALLLNVTGPLLNFVFQRAFQMAKQIRSETGIGRHPVSVGTVAMMLLEQIFGDFKALTGLVVGLGEMGGQVTKLLLERGVKKLYGSNRTCKRWEGSVEEIAWERWREVLPICDVVVTSTSAPSSILSKEKFIKREGFQVLIDLGVPRDIDPAIGDLDNVYLYNVDDLKTIADKNLAHRLQEARLAEERIRKECLIFQKEWNRRIAIFEDGKWKLENRGKILVPPKFSGV